MSSSILRCQRLAASSSTVQSRRTRPILCAASADQPCRPPLGRRLPLISRISYSVEHAALVQKFELVAARSAMMGCLMTVLFELGGTRVVPLDPEQGKLFLASLLLAMAAAASVAFTRRRVGGRLLLEGVLSSLTCSSRSASSLTSLTPSSLDASVDRVIDMAFTQEVTEWLKTSLDDYEASAAAAPR